MRKNYIFAFLAFSIVLGLIAYFSMETTEIAPVENEEQVSVNYNSNGQTDWVKVNTEYEACGRGQLQSPINIEVSNTAKEKPKSDVQLNYEEALFTVENNGHTIEANATNLDNSLVIGDDDYKFTAIHFHSPSEHQVNGQYYDMEAHLYHENEKGELAIIGLFIESGKENKLLAEMWEEIPKDGNEAEKLLKNPINLNKLLPEEKSVFHYVGSLTTPPCTEGINWFVVEEPIEMSNDQINEFSAIFLQNNRPIQELNDRDIFKIELN